MRFRRTLPLLLLALPSGLIFPILFRGKMLYGADVVSVFHYSRSVIAEAFRAGRLPTWDPHVMAGFPLLAELQNAIFYPPTWTCAFLSPGTFWTLSAWAHLVAAGLFARLWLRRGLGTSEEAALSGAVIFQLSGYLVGHLFAGHVNYVWAYAWLPALLWRLERFLAGPTLKRGVLLSLVFAMLVLAGVPQYVVFAGVLVAGRLALERGRLLARVLGWLALGLCIAAPQLLPTLELAGQMQRGSSDDPEFMKAYRVAFSDLPRLVLPPVTKDYFWETCSYFGFSGMLLLIAAFGGAQRQRRLWSSIATLGIVLSLLPWSLGPFRGPGRFLLLWTIAAVALAALGFDVLWRSPRRALRISAALLAFAAGLELLVFAHPLLRAQDDRILSLRPELAAQLRERCGLEYRVASTGGLPIEEVGKGQAVGVDQVGGYDPMMLRRYAELINAVRGAPIGQNMPLLASVAAHPTMDMLGARVWRAPRTPIRESPDALPRAWVLSNAVVIDDREERLRTLAKGPWDPRKTVILESFPSERPPIPVENPGRAKVVSRSAGRYEIEAENGADAYLVVSEAWYPGWSAEVDGREVEVLPANHLIQTVRLPAGKHRVTFTYRSRFLPAGFAIALLAGLVPVALAISSKRRARASAAASAGPSTGGS